MGCEISKSIEQHSSSHQTTATAADRTTSRSVNRDDFNLSSYEAACKADPDLQNFDSIIQDRTSRAIKSIAVNLDVQRIPLESLRDVTESLLEMNRGAVEMLLRNKRDIWKNKELSDLVDDYFENSLLTLDFCTALDSCLNRASHIQSIVNVAIRKFEEEHSTVPVDGSAKDYLKTLEELRNFRLVEDPFNEEFFNLFNSVHRQQTLMLEKLKTKKRKLDKKLRRLKAWRKVSNVLFVVAFASVLICSVVAAAVSAPPLLTALAAAATVPLGSMGKWLNSIWNKYENELMEQREILLAMEMGTKYFMIENLNSIRLLVDKFHLALEALSANADFAMREEEEVAVVVAVEEMKKEVNEFMETIQDLNKQADQCNRETRMARTLLLRKIMDRPSGFYHSMFS